MMDDFDLMQLVLPLQEWFLSHARVLPWREEPTAYRVWISEIMLQQTRVEAVKPYFERFIRTLPTVEALAKCPEDLLLKLWEGLGYYNRARNLRIAAGQIVEQYGGRIPANYEELLKLKGIGHYTAGAIASIAYEKAVPAVDGNVLRVMSRVTADDSDIMKQSVRTHMEEKLLCLMQSHPDIKPRIFNQALMELGATVCVPNGEPHCGECPWNKLCLAYSENMTAVLPVKTKKKTRKIEKRTVFIIRDGEKVAICKRPSKGLLAGLYELPNQLGYMEYEDIVSYMHTLGYVPLRIQALEDAKHVFSHVEWHMKGYMVFVQSEDMQNAGQTNSSGLLLVEAEDAKERYAIPSAFRAYAKYMNLRLDEWKKQENDAIIQKSKNE